MLRFMLDNLCIRVLRDRPAGLRPRFNAHAGSLAISTVVLDELLFGAERSARPDHNRREVERFASALEVLPFAAAAAAHSADIRAALQRQGRATGTYDLQIAGHARSRGLVVVTGNLTEIERVDGLRCEDWSPDAARNWTTRRARSSVEASPNDPHRGGVRTMGVSASSSQSDTGSPAASRTAGPHRFSRRPLTPARVPLPSRPGGGKIDTAPCRWRGRAGARSLTPPARRPCREEGLFAGEEIRRKAPVMTEQTLSRFADLAELYAEATATPDARAALREIAAASQVAPADEATAEMPDPREAELATELIVRTLFELLGGTRLERHADRLAWGIVHSFHKVAESLEAQADAAAQEVKRLAEEQDGSEVAGLALEEAQARCQGLDEAAGAVACLRDHAAEVYRVETGRPWASPRGSCVSARRTASVIAAADYLKARAEARRAKLAPEGPVVVFSGGQAWHDHAQLYARLDEIRARVPHMVLATTAQSKGCDAIAAAWAAARGVPLVAFTLNPSLGRRAAFKRNERLVALRPVEAVVCEGSGVQSNLYQLLRAAHVPCHAFRRDGQAPLPSAGA